MTFPESKIPFATTDIIAAIEQLSKLYISKLGYSKKCSGFHFYRNTTFSLAMFYFCFCFAIYRIGCPGFGEYVFALVCLEHVFNGCHSLWISSNFTTRW